MEKINQELIDNLLIRLADANHMVKLDDNIYSCQGKLYIVANIGFKEFDFYNDKTRSKAIELLTELLAKEEKELNKAKKKLVSGSPDYEIRKVNLIKNEIFIHKTRLSACCWE